LSLPPTVSSLHYALQCFEGLKSHRNLKGKDEIYLFRPELNAERFTSSCDRLALPVGLKKFKKKLFDEHEFVKCLAALVNLEREWVPKKEGYSLYIRPTMISTTSTLGVAAASDAKMVRSLVFSQFF
jgi:branched-chain amino acid aminotransferase